MKKNIITIILIIILIIAGIVFVLIKNNKQERPEKGLLKTEDVVEKEKEKIKIEQEKIIKTDLKNQARAFIQYYGTYSRKNAYKNREELLEQMTDDFIQKSLEQIKENLNQKDFISLKTNVLLITPKRSNDKVAVYLVDTKQTKVFLNTNKSENKIGEIVFLKQDKKWKVYSIDFNL